ncbi:Peptidoglycan-binding LysM [Nitrosococcus oceani ATCC 19707]|uniref:Peptidoglycan-binding LysM n=2 Tax=Nitrosococcus oceani TaxID=1229 RepID=Q3JDT3_NITOC|nr:LysM peptidoglycan-binding domain-containing protein [Nitrosococcus oceani]ABA57013.1 Peptidoglycan-binding LysM [Nitrosococcus oceani ATCC 19707]EDZ65813.1 LysM domain protein [Nitrosococcus oceani AFC27]KFI20589.1 peptigoglycan-binding protein LysM [Nitrosococcus oceani C-27]GEM20939.1 peptidoglycan-binding protein LysM [Nitrosococcus oceani]
MKVYLSLISTLTDLKNTIGISMAHSRPNIHGHYRRSTPKSFVYGPAKSHGGILSIVIVLLLIVVLATGAVWVYLGRQDEEVKVSNKDNDALVPQVSATKSTEPGSTELAADDQKYKSVPKEKKTTPEDEKDEFAAILEELNREEEKAEFEKSRESSPQLAREDKMPAQAPPEQADTPNKEDTFEQTSKEPYERGKVPTAEELGNTDSSRSKSTKLPPIQSEQPKPSGKGQEGEGINSKLITVQQGDSLSTIAARVYDDANKWRLIYKANKDKIKNPNQLSVGTKLTIPASK